MQKLAQIEGDAPGGSVYHTHEIQHGLIEATNVLKWKIIKILSFNKCRKECRFPRSTYRGSHSCDFKMHLLLMILYVDLSLFSNCVFSLNYVMPHS
jgi:hypothetical protein